MRRLSENHATYAEQTAQEMAENCGMSGPARSREERMGLLNPLTDSENKCPGG